MNDEDRCSEVVRVVRDQQNVIGARVLEARCRREAHHDGRHTVETADLRTPEGVGVDVIPPEQATIELVMRQVEQALYGGEPFGLAGQMLEHMPDEWRHQLVRIRSLALEAHAKR